MQTMPLVFLCGCPTGRLNDRPRRVVRLISAHHRLRTPAPHRLVAEHDASLGLPRAARSCVSNHSSCRSVRPPPNMTKRRAGPSRPSGEFFSCQTRQRRLLNEYSCGWTPYEMHIDGQVGHRPTVM